MLDQSLSLPSGNWNNAASFTCFKRQIGLLDFVEKLVFL